jgi:6-phosphogluconolactonase
MRIVRYQSHVEAAANVVDEVAALLSKASDTDRSRTVVLPGGNSPRHFLPSLFALPLDWQHIAILPSDERCVPPTHAARNEAMLERMRRGTPAERSELHSLLTEPAFHPATLKAKLLPATLAILGMGADGHIASLFSLSDFQSGATIALHRTASPDGNRRVSLSSDTLCASEQILLFLGGRDKLAALERALSGDASVASLFFSRRPDCSIHAYIE